MKLKTLLLALLVCNTAVFAQTKKPNIIYILADDLGIDGVSCYGADLFKTPVIDKLASTGIRYTNGYTAPLCGPSRALILTGRYAFRTGAVNQDMTGQMKPSVETMMPSILKQAGYTSSMVGKWGQLPLGPAEFGFDDYLRFFGSGVYVSKEEKKQKYVLNGQESVLKDKEYMPDLMHTHIENFLSKHTKDPFYLYYSMVHVHGEIMATPDSKPGATDFKELYTDNINYMDKLVGKLLRTLDSLKIRDNTIIVFMGDNGNSTRTAQIADTSRAKGSVYQYGVHVPFIIAGPSVVNPNRVSGALINTADVFATVLELFGYTTWQTQIPTAKPVDSKSILPIIKNQTTQVRPWAFTEIFKLNTDSSDGNTMRNTDYKLIKFDYGAQRFYNLTLDPNENNNLLTGSLSYNDVTNYYALCNAMTTLVGSGSFCNNAITTGVENFNPLNKDIKLYPNPSKNKLYLSFKHPTFQVSEIKIIDAVVKTISDIKDMNLQNGIDIHAYHSGFYYLQIIDKKTKNSTIKKFVIE